MKPVAAIAIYWLAETFSAGFLKSPTFAIVIAHLKVGAQKKTKKESKKEAVLLVKGPAGCSNSDLMLAGQGRVITAF
jgi:hypothetical protein